MSNKLFIAGIVTLLTFSGITVAVAAPEYTFQKGLLPVANDTYYIGTSSPSLNEWNGIYTKNLTISGTCTGCASLSSLSITKGNFLVGSDAGVAQATSSIFITSTGQVGVGLTSIASVFEVKATSTAATGQAFIAWDSANKNLFQITNNGNVGLSTTSPSQVLSVQGNALISGDITSVANITATGTVKITPLTTGSVLFSGASGAVSQNNSQFFWDNTNNRLGLGSTTPIAQFSINPNGITGPIFAIGSTTSTKLLVTNAGNIAINGADDPVNIGVVQVGGGQTGAAATRADASNFEISGYFDSPFVSFGEYQNLLLQSEALNTVANWISSVGVIGTNNASDPTGGVTAENIPAGTVPTDGIKQTRADSVTGNQTFSVWLRAQSGTGTTSLQIDYGNGAATTTGTNVIFPLTTAWKRYAVTQNTDAAHTQLTVSIMNGTTAISAWGAALENATTSRAYRTVTTAAATIQRSLLLRSPLIGNSVSFSGITTLGNAGTITNTMTSLATTTTNATASGLYLLDSTAATAALNAQQAPRIVMEGKVWDGTVSTSTTWFMDAIPVSATVPTNTFSFKYANGGNATSTKLAILSTGQVGVGTTSPFASLSVMGATTTIPFAISTTTLTFASSTLFMVDQSGDLHLGGGVPVLSGCGTAPTLDANSTDQAGTVTFGATAGGCTITFSVAKASKPHCAVTTQAQSLANAYTYTESASAIVITQTASGGTVWDYVCALGH